MSRSSLLSWFYQVLPRLHEILKTEKFPPGKTKLNRHKMYSIFTAKVISYSMGQKLFSKFHSELLIDVIRLEFAK